jgi:hypothetical protein
VLLPDGKEALAVCEYRGGLRGSRAAIETDCYRREFGSDSLFVERSFENA